MAWALVDPAGWYRTVPAFGRHWVAANPPYNDHLATEAGLLVISMSRRAADTA